MRFLASPDVVAIRSGDEVIGVHARRTSEQCAGHSAGACRDGPGRRFAAQLRREILFRSSGS